MILLNLFLSICVPVASWDKADYCFHTGSRKIPPLSDTETALIDSVAQIQIIHRHGSRSDLQYGLQSPCFRFHHEFICTENKYAQNPEIQVQYIRDEVFGSCSSGQLLPRGIKQLRKLGRNLKEAYFGDSKLQIPLDIPAHNISVFSTDFQRTRMSLQSLLNSIWPNGQTLEVWSFPQSLSVNTPPRGCKSFEEIRKTVPPSPVVEELKRKQPHEVGLIEMFSGRSLENSYPFFDCISSKACDGMDLESNGISHETMNFMRDVIYEISANDAEYLSDFASAGFLGLIQDKIKQIERYKLAIWSAHDSTAIFLLQTLGVWDRQWPQFANSIVFEIYKMKDGFGSPFAFRMIRNEKVLEFPGCTARDEMKLCDLEVLKRKIARTALGRHAFYESCRVSPSLSELLSVQTWVGASAGHVWFPGFFICFGIVVACLGFGWQKYGSTRRFAYTRIPGSNQDRRPNMFRDFTI